MHNKNDDLVLKDKLEIIPYKPSDLDSMMEIEMEAFAGAHWSKESYEELAPLDSISIRVAKIGDKLVGYMLFQHFEGEMELHTIAVHKDYRNQKIGRALVEYMLKEASTLGVNWVFLQVRPSSKYALGLYQSFGFRKIGVRKRYYRNDGEDAYVMRLDFGNGS